MFLAVFNLIPIPPLDGSGILIGLISEEAAQKVETLRPFGFIIVLGLVYLGVLRFIFRPHTTGNQCFSYSKMTDTYQVKLEIFEGPLDLLLFLIKKKKLEIHDIPMATITRTYLDYLNDKEQINLEREAEFLLVAALLIHIKSQMLLPREAALEDDSDPRKVLVDRLLDHQKIKAACNLLREKEKDRMQTWQRDFLPPISPSDELDFIEVSLFDLAEVFFTLMKRQERDQVRVLKGKEFSLKEKTQEIIALLKENGYLDFLAYFAEQRSFEEALFAFFCILELVKNKVVVAIQDSLFSTIKVWLREEFAT